MFPDPQVAHHSPTDPFTAQSQVLEKQNVPQHTHSRTRAHSHRAIPGNGWGLPGGESWAPGQPVGQPGLPGLARRVVLQAEVLQGTTVWGRENLPCWLFSGGLETVTTNVRVWAGHAQPATGGQALITSPWAPA